MTIIIEPTETIAIPVGDPCKCGAGWYVSVMTWDFDTGKPTNCRFRCTGASCERTPNTVAELEAWVLANIRIARYTATEEAKRLRRWNGGEGIPGEVVR